MPKMKVRLGKILRDEAKNMLGRTPAQGWLKPEQVTLFMPRLGRLSDLGNPAHDGLEKLEFVVDRPWTPFLPHTHPVRPSPDILDRFLRLAAAPASQIHQFASRFGPLFIFCKIDQRNFQTNWSSLRIVQCGDTSQPPWDHCCVSPPVSMPIAGPIRPIGSALALVQRTWSQSETHLTIH